MVWEDGRRHRYVCCRDVICVSLLLNVNLPLQWVCLLCPVCLCALPEPRDVVCVPVSPTRSPDLAPARILSPSALPLLRLPPDRHWIDAFPFAAKLFCPYHPQKPTVETLKHRPRRIGRLQKRKTPLLYVARVVHRPLVHRPSRSVPRRD
jgi:hypothetical protein